MDKPYNMDESGMPLDHKQLKRVALKWIKKVHGPSSGNKAQITILACANAVGSIIPPMVIFKGERLNYEWTRGEVPDTKYAMSPQVGLGGIGVLLHDISCRNISRYYYLSRLLKMTAILE